jgi:hypothetical protein
LDSRALNRGSNLTDPPLRPETAASEGGRYKTSHDANGAAPTMRGAHHANSFHRKNVGAPTFVILCEEKRFK